MSFLELAARAHNSAAMPPGKLGKRIKAKSAGKKTYAPKMMSKEARDLLRD